MSDRISDDRYGAARLIQTVAGPQVGCVSRQVRAVVQIENLRRVQVPTVDSDFIDGAIIETVGLLRIVP